MKKKNAKKERFKWGIKREFRTFRETLLHVMAQVETAYLAVKRSDAEEAIAVSLKEAIREMKMLVKEARWDLEKF